MPNPGRREKWTHHDGAHRHDEGAMPGRVRVPPVATASTRPRHRLRGHGPVPNAFDGRTIDVDNDHSSGRMVRAYAAIGRPAAWTTLLPASQRRKRRPPPNWHSTPSSRATRRIRKAADCLSKDRDSLLAFYDFPAEALETPATTNPIESTFSTVATRTIRSKRCLSNKTALANGIQAGRGRPEKLAPSRRSTTSCQNSFSRVTFNDGFEVIAKPTDREPKTAAA